MGRAAYAAPSEVESGRQRSKPGPDPVGRSESHPNGSGKEIKKCCRARGIWEGAHPQPPLARPQVSNKGLMTPPDLANLPAGHPQSSPGTLEIPTIRRRPAVEINA